MAVSFTNLWPTVISWDNLCAAYRACRRRKRHKREAVKFDFRWEANLASIQQELSEETYVPGEYRHFRINDPKPRKISAAPFRDRVVHHALVRVLEPLFERRFINDSYACRRGKGTHRALDRAQQYARRHRYFLKSDIVRFFPNVDHEILIARLERTLRDRQVMSLVRSILKSGEGVFDDESSPVYFPGDDLFAVLRPRGLPIGNLTSQFFANIYLDSIDHYVKEEMRVPGFVRYADDFVLFGDSKEQLWEYRDQLSRRLATLRLRLHQDKTHVGACKAGIHFLGFVLKPDSRRLQQRVIKRFGRRLKRLKWLFKHGRIDAKQVRQSLQAWTSHARHANSHGIRRALWRRVRLSRPRRTEKPNPPRAGGAPPYPPSS